MSKNEETYLKSTEAINCSYVQSRNFAEPEIPLVENSRISKKDGV
jgi:hypothetical protein